MDDIKALVPDLLNPTSAEDVARLTGPQRVIRVRRLIDQAANIVVDACDVHSPNHEIVGRVVLYSGGNDSTVLAHLMHRVLAVATHAAHANTTIGIEATREFVRDTCRDWGLPLIEKFPPTDYETLVVEHGFPGPGHHFKMYQRLKERCLRQVRREFVDDPRRQRVLFIAGRRRSESQRRSGFRANGQAQVLLHEREGSTVWCSPLAMWTKLDLNTYRQMYAGVDRVPVNEVSELLHMSGECLCGSFAKEGELDEIRMWFPDVAEEIERIQRAVSAAGHSGPRAVWGHRKGKPTGQQGMLCSSCEFVTQGG